MTGLNFRLTDIILFSEGTLVSSFKMSLNKWMHEKNPYKTPPNFKEMAVKYPEFRKVVTQDLAGKIHLDFNNPAAVRTLTRLLFLKDFGLTVEIPEGSLVPTLPSRMNYLLWVEDLLSLLPERREVAYDHTIGTCNTELPGTSWNF